MFLFCFIVRETKEFTWEVDEGERIWIQVIHMNLTTNVSDILHTGECKTNPTRIEIYESKLIGFGLISVLRPFNTF